MDQSSGVQLQIGEWVADAATQRISNRAVIVQLEPRAFSLLWYLAQRAGEVVSIGELLDELWPRVTVSPDSVYQAVTALRRQLGDDPKRPRYIANVPRQGYRLVARVTSSSTSDEALARARDRVPATLALALLGFAAAAIGGSLIIGGYFNAAAAHPARIAVLPFADMTNAMDQEILVDNLTEDLIDRMSRHKGIQTAGARSSFALKGRKLASIEAARILKVDYVVEGSVRQVEGPLQLTARLVRADTGLVVWSKTYQTSVANLDVVEVEITTEVARAASGG